MNKAVLDKIKDKIRDLVIYGTNPEDRQSALNIYDIMIKEKTEDCITVNNVNIPIFLYNEVVPFMRENQKIKAIKELRRGFSPILGLKEAKEIVEKMSFMEKIPMASGYQDE